MGTNQRLQMTETRVSAVVDSDSNKEKNVESNDCMPKPDSEGRDTLKNSTLTMCSDPKDDVAPDEAVNSLVPHMEWEWDYSGSAKRCALVVGACQ